MNRIIPDSVPASCAGTVSQYDDIRSYTDRLVSELTDEDQCLQSMPDASPAKWHRAHTTWFFEQFVLRRFLTDYKVFDPEFDYLFNSYYDTVGPRHPQAKRGLISRPSVAEVDAYRRHVDKAMARLLPLATQETAAIIEIGLQHEQQHQELLVTDMLDAFARGHSVPRMLPHWQEPTGASGITRSISHSGGLVEIGHTGGDFSFDNECPRHHTYLAPFQIASRLVRNEEWLQFIDDRGYQNPLLWMADGWQTVLHENWTSPLHWRDVDGAWHQAGPNGLHPIIPQAPVRHISWYEADAYARWAGARLPTEAEWELSCSTTELQEMFGVVWQWTASAYRPYPGFKTAAGALGEYNGKFMINKMVLRGSSSATPPGHSRTTYRNFFSPHQRWQFTGARLAYDV